MLLMVEFKDLTLSIKQWKILPTYNPNAPTVVVVMDSIESEEEKDEWVMKVFEELRQNGFLNVNVLYQMKNDPFKMISATWFPYFNDSCPSKVENIEIVDECIVSHSVDDDTKKVKNSKEIKPFKQEMYPKIPNTFHNCPMKVSAVLWEPFVVGNETIESGLEILMLKTIADQMELKLNFKILGDEVITKKITDDNKTGLYADLIQK
jgi:hypothetical protein